MAMVEIGGAKRFINPDKMDLKVGDTVVEGIYVRPYMGNMGLNHEFRDLVRGDLVVISGGALNHKLKDIKPGTRVRIEWGGKFVLERGKWKGKECKDWKVFAEDPLTPAPATTQAAATATKSTSADDEEIDLDDPF